ncbi:MAG: DNA polymerase III subunit alpha [Anaerolineae bacterium]|nr:DNA polymerase III subunit alpha [Anaerolineae bacterium]
MYIHLTTHSAFSLQEGLPLPAEIVRAAKAAGMSAIGLTDHRLLTGMVSFVKACQQEGIQPLVGLEIDIEGGKLALFASNVEGWANLCRISSFIMLSDDSKRDCPIQVLEKYHAGLISIAILDVESKNEEILTKLSGIYNNSLYVGLNNPASALYFARLAKRKGLPCVACHPIYYLTAEQKDLQQTLTAIRLNCRRDNIPTGDLLAEDGYFLNPQEMQNRFEHFPAALAATEEIAARCQFDFPLYANHMPKIQLPEGETAAGYLRKKAFEGARRLYGEFNSTVRERLEYELKVIEQMGYEPIFLIVEEILNYARNQGVPYSSRGSAASSLVAHCLDITGPDPLELNLFFERFLNPARSTPPDIDTDLCSRRRDAVIRHVFEVYGAERVAMVGTINRYRPRSALGDVAKTFGWPAGRIRELSSQLPGAFFARRQSEENDKADDSPFKHLIQADLTPDEMQVVKQAEAILKLPRHLSVHAGGLIVAPEKLTDLIALMPSGNKGITITQFELDDVEALGLVKIDLLGIRGLTVLGDVAEFIGQNREKNTVKFGRLDVLDSIPDYDNETSQRIETGQTIGCFQVESPGMRSTLREIHARSEEDIMAALALYRPGPLNGGLKDAFVRRYKGEEKIQHLHPRLVPLLEETFGVILYQEQVLKIASELAGFTLAEADMLRRAMGHFDPGKQMQILKDKFINQMQTRCEADRDVCNRVWEMMAAFAGYGFPKAHAASYAKVAWRSAWCKTYFPAEFMAAVLANHGGYYSQHVYINETRRMGIKVYAPDINYSKLQFSVQKTPEKALYMGLDQVKGLTRSTIEKIILNQPFYDFEQFLMFVNPRGLEVKNLAMVGAFKGLGSIPTILERLNHSGWQNGQMSLFKNYRSPGDVDWSTEKISMAQLELLGISLEANPIEVNHEKLTTLGAVDTLEAAGKVGKRIKVAGLKQSSHRSRTSRGETMMFLSLEDMAGVLDVVVFPEIYRKSRLILNSNELILVSGVMEIENGQSEPYLRAEHISFIPK